MNKLYILFASLLVSACTSHPVIPDKNDVIVSRNEASVGCKSLGPVEGRSNRVNATTAEALDDLKSEAVKKGSNFVKIETMGALASSIRGIAFICN